MAGLLVMPAQQKDFLCGSFCTARVLNELGFDAWEGEPLDEDLVAARAGATVPNPDLPPVLPLGASSRRAYRHALPVAPLDEAGTSAAGLIGVIESATAKGLRAVPVRGNWPADRVGRLVDRATSMGARLIANVDTGQFWGSHPSSDQLIAELRGDEVAGPPPDWETGHFVELTMLVRGPMGALVAVRDTYPELGLDGYHLQPPRAMAAAMLRGDGREGGVLAVVRPANAAAVEALASELGLEV